MKTKKHIDVITKYFYPVSAGIETNILETYSELVRIGWSVTVHTTSSTLDKQNSLSTTDNIRGIQVMRYQQGIFHFIPKIDYEHTNLICLHNFNIFPHIIIYIHSIVRRIFRMRNPNIFLTPHGGATPEWSTFPFAIKIIKQLYNRIIGRLLINTQSIKVRAISEWEQQALMREGINPKKIILIENGLDIKATLNHDIHATQNIKKIVKSFNKYFVMIGRIAPIKNYETMISALALVPGTAKLVIIGPVQDKNYLQQLTKLSDKLGISDRIIFLGPLHNSDKYYVIMHALALIHLARWESFCNVVHEAKSINQICVVADNTALTSLIKNRVNGFVTPTYDHIKLSKILLSLDNNSAKTVVHKIHGKLNQESFPTWNITANKMHNYYQKIAL